jgi:hypothetical protein
LVVGLRHRRAREVPRRTRPVRSHSLPDLTTVAPVGSLEECGVHPDGDGWVLRVVAVTRGGARAVVNRRVADELTAAALLEELTEVCQPTSGQ